jgi:ribosomal protein S25
MVQPERRNARIRRLGTVSGSQRQRMNPIVAQRQLLREILDEVLQFQPQARYESLLADPMYLKVCLARRHLRQLAAAQKVALGRPLNVASIKSVPAP